MQNINLNASGHVPTYLTFDPLPFYLTSAPQFILKKKKIFLFSLCHRNTKKNSFPSHHLFFFIRNQIFLLLCGMTRIKIIITYHFSSSTFHNFCLPPSHGLIRFAPFKTFENFLFSLKKYRVVRQDKQRIKFNFGNTVFD